MTTCLAAFFATFPTMQPAHANDAGACFSETSTERRGLPAPEIVTPEIFDELIGWIALNTSYDLRSVYRSPPTLSFCIIGDIVDYEGTDLLVERGLLAAFDSLDRHIYLVEPWSTDSVFNRSVLLHEMIHDVQFSTQDWECSGAPELEAYLLQDKWLRERGVVYPFNWRAIVEVSRCQTENKGDFAPPPPK